MWCRAEDGNATCFEPRRHEPRTSEPEEAIPATPPAPADQLRRALTPAEVRAAREFVARVRGEVQADLVSASLFGSKARGDARPDSDIDILLVFRSLPPDREPHASHAEEVAEEVATRTGVPVTVWSVSLVDLAMGNRTPMLVDALRDSIPIWWKSHPLPALPFTPADALRCVRALLQRLEEGSEEFSAARRRGDWRAAARRARDDLVRLCTAILLLAGITRPRRGEAVRCLVELETELVPPVFARRVLSWAANSYGRDGRDEEGPVSLPPGGLDAAAEVIDVLSGEVRRRARDLLGGAGPEGTPRRAGVYR